jgi:hypothetical protein
MIQPDKLRQFNVKEIPPAVFQAWETHRHFVTMSSFAAESIGVRFLEGVKPDTIALGFFRSMLENGGTDKDMDWLIANDVVEQAANSFWNVAVDEYANGGWS